MASVSRPILRRQAYLGKGSLGKVYKVLWQPEIEGGTIEAAAKRIPCKEKDWKLLRCDIGSLSKLDHVNIVKFYATILLAPLAFILTEYVVNGSLFDFLKRQSRLPSDLLEKWILNLTHAIKYLQMNHIKSLNVKSPNCLLTDDNVLKICDYGILNVHRVCKASKTPSIWWLAPEILRQEPSVNAEVFAFGIVVWEMVTCQEPYEGLSTDEVKTEVLYGCRPKIPEDCPSVLSNIMHQCWHGKADQRPDIEDILKFLRQVYVDTDIVNEDWEFERSFELDKAMSMSEVIAVKPDEDMAIAKNVQRLHVYNMDGYYQFSGDSSHRLQPTSSDGSNTTRIVVLDSDLEIRTYGTNGQYKHNVNMGPRSPSLSDNDILELSEVYSYNHDNNEPERKMVYNYSEARTQRTEHCSRPYRSRVVFNSHSDYIFTDRANTVKVVDPKGNFKYEWEPLAPGKSPTDRNSEEPKTLEELRGIAIDASGCVLVGVEAANQRYVSKHRDDGTFVSSVYVDISPIHIAPTSHGTILISDGDAKVCFVGPRRRHSRYLVPPYVPAHEWRPGGVCCCDNIVFISNFTRHKIECFSAFNGSYLGSPISDLNHPPQGLAISWDASKLLICTEYEVQVYQRPDKDAEQLEKISMNIDYSGNTFSNQDTSLTIPKGALPKDHTVNISIGIGGQTYPPLQPDQLVLSPTICCKPDGQNFLKPITLTIPDCFVGITPKCIQVWCKSKHTDWVKIYDGEKRDTQMEDAGVMVESNKIKIRVKHFSLFSAVIRMCKSWFALKYQILVYMYPRKISAFKDVVMTIYAIRDRDSIATTKQLVEEEEARFGGTICAKSNPFLLQPNGHNLQVVVKDTEPKGCWIPNDTMSGVIPYDVLQHPEHGGKGAHCEIKFHKQDNRSVSEFIGALTVSQVNNPNTLNNIYFYDHHSRSRFNEPNPASDCSSVGQERVGINLVDERQSESSVNRSTEAGSQMTPSHSSAPETTLCKELAAKKKIIATIINKSTPYLCEFLKIDDAFLRELVAKDIITDEEKDRIKATPIRGEKVEIVLEIVKTSTFGYYDRFMKALQGKRTMELYQMVKSIEGQIGL